MVRRDYEGGGGWGGQEEKMIPETFLKSVEMESHRFDRLLVFPIQNNHRVIETKKAEVGIKGKGMIDSVCIDEGKTGAVEKTEPRGVKFPEDVFRAGFDTGTYRD